jgi:hypothetical protein
MFLFFRLFGAKQTTESAYTLRGDILKKGSLISLTQKESLRDVFSFDYD